MTTATHMHTSTVAFAIYKKKHLHYRNYYILGLQNWKIQIKWNYWALLILTWPFLSFEPETDTNSTLNVI